MDQAILLANITLSVIVAFFAHEKGRNTVSWFFFALVTTLPAFIAIIAVSDLRAERQRQDWELMEADSRMAAG